MLWAVAPSASRTQLLTSPTLCCFAQSLRSVSQSLGWCALPITLLECHSKRGTLWQGFHRCCCAQKCYSHCFESNTGTRVSLQPQSVSAAFSSDRQTAAVLSQGPAAGCMSSWSRASGSCACAAAALRYMRYNWQCMRYIWRSMQYIQRYNQLSRYTLMQVHKHAGSKQC
jgi:hypothetical protein